MYSRYDRHQKHILPFTVYFLLAVLTVFVFLFTEACTKDESQKVQGKKIVMPIKKPMPKPTVPLETKAPQEGYEGTQGPGQPSPDKLSEPPHEPSEAMQGPSEPPEETKGEKGVYKVRKGDNLIKVAAREEVYADPLKWTSLFRMNMDKFDGLEINADFQERELPEGLGLKFVTESEAKENREKFGRKVYAVNVISSETPRKIVLPAITLLKNGHNAYICTATVKGKKWLRLRSGFFNSYSEALTAGEQIATILNGRGVWIARVNNNELEQYGGY